jgi:hypothetical protein
VVGDAIGPARPAGRYTSGVMTLVRRGLAVLLQLFLLQASVLGSGPACVARLRAPAGAAVEAGAVAPAATSAPDAGPGTAHAAMHHERAPGAADAAAGASARRDRPAEPRPHGPTHCGLTLGCTAVLLAARSGELPSLAWRDAGVRVALVSSPHADRAAPAPPPPRG